MFFFGPYLGGAILWFITVWITQEHELDWYVALRWVAFAGIIGLIVYAGLSFAALEQPQTVATIASITARTTALFYFIWREFRGYGLKKVFEIVGLYVGWSAVTSIGYHLLRQT